MRMTAKLFRRLLRAIIFVWVLIILVDCHPKRRGMDNTVTRLSDLSPEYWRARLGNPCGYSPTRDIKPREALSVDRSLDTPAKFFKTMLLDVELALTYLDDAEKENANLCLKLGDLPSVHLSPTTLNDLTCQETLVQAYHTGISLVAHLDQIIWDRGITPGNEVSEEKNEFYQCQNQSKDFLQFVSILIQKFEDMLCTLFDGTSEIQRRPFSGPLKQVLDTNMQSYRYYPHCIDFELRDCLVLRHARTALTDFQQKFIQIIKSDSHDCIDRAMPRLVRNSLED